MPSDGPPPRGLTYRFSKESIDDEAEIASYIQRKLHEASEAYGKAFDEQVRALEQSSAEERARRGSGMSTEGYGVVCVDPSCEFCAESTPDDENVERGRE